MVVSGAQKEVRSFEDLRVYTRLVELHLEIHRLTLGFPRYEMYELGSQLRRSSNSIPANLAEGWNNRHLNVYIEGINRSLGELRETTHHLLIAFRKGYLSETTFQSLKDRFAECGKMLRGLQRSLEGFVQPSTRTKEP